MQETTIFSFFPVWFFREPHRLQWVVRDFDFQQWQKWQCFSFNQSDLNTSLPINIYEDVVYWLKASDQKSFLLMKTVVHVVVFKLQTTVTVHFLNYILYTDLIDFWHECTHGILQINLVHLIDFLREVVSAPGHLVLLDWFSETGCLSTRGNWSARINFSGSLTPHWGTSFTRLISSDKMPLLQMIKCFFNEFFVITLSQREKIKK